MPRIQAWSIAVVVLVGCQAMFLHAADLAAPVAEWQVKGTLAALKDKHPEVREKAALKFVELLTAGEKGGWKDDAQKTAEGEDAKEDFVRLMKDKDEEPAVRVAAAGALAKLKDIRAIPSLIELCKDKDPSARLAAAVLLGVQKDERVIAGLVELLRDAYPAVRNAASGPLGKLMDIRALPGLLSVLKDKEPLARAAAADLLGKLKDGSAVSGLLDALKDKDPAVRRAAATALGQLNDARAVPGLIELLKDDNSSVRTAANAALVRLGDKSAVPNLLDLLNHETQAVRSAAASVLGKLKDRRAVPRLLSLLRDRAPYVRNDAAAALGTLADREAVPGLLELLNDGQSDVRAKVAELLGKLQDDRVAPALRKLLKDNDPAVRIAGLGALVKRKDEQAVPAVLELLKDKDITLRFGAAELLGELNDARAIPGLIELLKETDPYSRLIAISALAALKDEKAVPALIELLKDADPNVRSAALAALGTRPDKRSVPALLKLLTDADPTVRSAAAQLLAKLQDDSAAVVLLAKEADPAIRTEAAVALGRLGDPEAVKALLDLIKDGAAVVRAKAAEQLGKVKEDRALPGLLTLLKDKDSGVKQAVAMALGPHKDDRALPGLLTLLKDKDSSVKQAVARALGARKDDPAAVKGLVELLRDADSTVRTAASGPLGKLMDIRVLPGLLSVLKDKEPLARAAAANLLGNLRDGRAVSGLLDALKDEDHSVRRAAAAALGEINEARAIPGLIELRKDDKPDVRKEAALSLGKLGDKAAVTGLLDLLKDDDHAVRNAAVAALGKLQDPAALPGFMRLLKDKDPNVRKAAFEQCQRLRPKSVLGALELPYAQTSLLHDARWLAHYWGGGEEPATSLCAYFDIPSAEPELPKNCKDAQLVLDVLAGARKESSLRSLQRDAARWIAKIITNLRSDWKPEHKEILEGYKKQLASGGDEDYAAPIQRVIDPLEVWRVGRTVLAVLLINVVAVLLIVLRPGRAGIEKWLPSLGFAGAGLGSWAVNTATQLYLEPWLLGGLLVGELVVLLGLGLVSPPVLRQVAQIEPLNRIAVPVALRLPWSRRRLFRDFLQKVRSQLRRDKRQANDETYVAIPADIRCHDRAGVIPEADPAAAILRFVTGHATQRGHVIIEATGGRGKSALLREVVGRAINQFEGSPGSSPLPVLLTGAGDSIEDLLKRTLAPVLVSPDQLAAHLEAGDFFLVLDGVSESGLSAKALSTFIDGQYGDATPLLLTSRPAWVFRYVIEGAARWMVAEPRRLDETTLGEFVKGYGGKELPAPLRAACRGADGTYLPILVRMAMVLGGDGRTRGSVADIYRHYFLRLFTAQLPDEGERLKSLAEAARWCLETYWLDGSRLRAYQATPLQQQLLQAGILVPADEQDPPSQVQFFHDSMQSYLTAYGLAAEDQAGYVHLPQPADCPGADVRVRGRILLRAAAHPAFARARSDILQTGGTELYQMCLATFKPGEMLRPWLRDELLSWADEHHEDLRRRDIVDAIPPAILEPIKATRGAANLLEKAARACYAADEPWDCVDMLGQLYAGVAPLIYELAEGER